MNQWCRQKELFNGWSKRNQRAGRGINLARSLASGLVNKDNPLFVYIKIPGDLDPFERWEQFEKPLQKALEKDGLGEVTGGGSQFSEPDEDGPRVG